MEHQRVKHEPSSVKLQISHDTHGAWQCRISTEEGDQIVQFEDQAALNSYIAHQIDLFVSEYDRAHAA